MNTKIFKHLIYAGFLVVFCCVPVFGASITAPAANSNQNRLVPTVKQPNISNPSSMSGQVRLTSADLTVAIDCPDSALLRTNFTCKVTIINLGPQAIPRADLYIMGAGAKIISANWPGCNQSSGYTYCYKDGLRPAESATLVLTAYPLSNDSAAIEVSARLQNARDTNDSNNTAKKYLRFVKDGK